MRRALSFENIEVAQDAQGTSEYGASLALAEARRVLTELHCETNELEGEHDKHAWEYAVAGQLMECVSAMGKLTWEQVSPSIWSVNPISLYRQ